MKTTAVRLHGVKDLRVDTFDLPEYGDDTVICKIVSDGVCMSSYKTSLQGANHMRVPDNIEEHPIVIGHECCGEYYKVGKNFRDRYKEGDKFVLQPVLLEKGVTLGTVGYGYEFCGGVSTFSSMHPHVMRTNSLFNCNFDSFFTGSLVEPYSSVIAGYHAMYHSPNMDYKHEMGIVKGGKLLLVGACGAMGIGALDIALHGDRNPALLVVTDLDQKKLDRVAAIFTPEAAKVRGIELHYVNPAKCTDYEAEMMALTGGSGFNDIIVMAINKAVLEQCDRMLAFDGCLNFFAGPTDKQFGAEMNMYNVHYKATHYVGTSGSNTDDMREIIRLFEEKVLHPAAMLTHIGGMDAAAETTLNVPNLPGCKKVIYTHIRLPLTAIEDFAELGRTDPLFARLDSIVKANGGIWCAEAERYLLENAPPVI